MRVGAKINTVALEHGVNTYIHIDEEDDKIMAWCNYHSSYTLVVRDNHSSLYLMRFTTKEALEAYRKENRDDILFDSTEETR